MREIADNGSGEGERVKTQDVVVEKKEIVEESEQESMTDAEERAYQEKEEKVLVSRSQAKQETEQQVKIEKVVKEDGVVSRIPEEIVMKAKHDEEEDGGEAEVHTVGCEAGLELPVPTLSEGEDDGLKLREEMLHNVTLKNIRDWEDKKENGYRWQDGLLKHAEEDGAGETFDQLVVPTSRKKHILKLAHTIPMAGHMSDKKTRALLRRNYTWPGITRDVAEWCKTCPKCQLVKKTSQSKVPLQPMPIVSEPFEFLAFDIIGPFERSRQGYKYVLTAMCLASKYPEAIPLKDIRAETVAEGMLEIFSRTGIPKKLHTDQGQQFIGKLHKQLCQRLQIQKLRTSAYLPQMNRCLERWHGTLVPMIKKSIVNKLDWDKQVKLALFAYRCAPHSNTGFSPFEIIFGRNVRGPTEILKDSWENVEKEKFNVSVYVEELQKRLQKIRDTVLERERERQAKDRMKTSYDAKTKPREFQEGSMVLLRVPGLCGKLSDAWDGPYDVHRKISDVNYEVTIPNVKGKKKIVHVNKCKQWHQSDASVLRIVVAAKEKGEEDVDNLKL